MSYLLMPYNRDIAVINYVLDTVGRILVAIAAAYYLYLYWSWPS